MGYLTSRRGDEFYTLPEDVSMILDQYLPTLQGRRILCPCDTSTSAFVQYMLAHDLDVTWDDRLDYESFDFAAFDFVITNPPFSLMGAFLRRIASAGVGGIIICPIASIGHACVPLFAQGWRATDEGVPDLFRGPNGEMLRATRIAVLRSKEFPGNIWEGTKRREPPRYEDARADEGYPIYSRVSAVPDTWSGVIAVPVTWTCVKYDPERHEVVSAVSPHIDRTATFKRFLVRERERNNHE